MRLVVGLGNPGKEYDSTRHNVGFMLLDYLLKNEKFKLNKKMNALECEKNVCGEKILFIKPLSYMNLVGEVVLKYMNFYKLTGEDLLVIQDDLDMSIGSFKLTYNHGDGGHNGIKNIVLNLDSKEFLRLKIGISKINDIDIKDYVLGNFSKVEKDKIKDVFNNFDEFLDDYVCLNRDLLMGKYNSKLYCNEG